MLTLNTLLLSNDKNVHIFHLCAPVFSCAGLSKDNCFNWWMEPKWLLFSFLTLCQSLSPLYQLIWFIDRTPESRMLSENHFSRGCFKSHSVWLAKITFLFTGGVCGQWVGITRVHGGGRWSEVCSCSKKLYELQIFNFLGWKVSRSRLLYFFELKWRSD